MLTNNGPKPKSTRVLRAQQGKLLKLEQIQTENVEKRQIHHAKEELRKPLSLRNVDTTSVVIGQMSQYQGEQCVKKYKALQSILHYYTNSTYSLFDILFGIVSKQAASYYSFKHSEKISTGTSIDTEIL